MGPRRSDAVSRAKGLMCMENFRGHLENNWRKPTALKMVYRNVWLSLWVSKILRRLSWTLVCWMPDASVDWRN